MCRHASSKHQTYYNGEKKHSNPFERHLLRIQGGQPPHGRQEDEPRVRQILAECMQSRANCDAEVTRLETRIHDLENRIVQMKAIHRGNLSRLQAQHQADWKQKLQENPDQPPSYWNNQYNNRLSNRPRGALCSIL